jgi:hypothetical protein
VKVEFENEAVATKERKEHKGLRMRHNILFVISAFFCGQIPFGGAFCPAVVGLAAPKNGHFSFFCGPQKRVGVD